MTLALFFTTGEGTMEHGQEIVTGYCIDHLGRVHDWSTDGQWEDVMPESWWSDDPEYRAARRAVGLA